MLNSSLDPIITRPFSYINGLNLLYATPTALTVRAGACRADNSTQDIVIQNDILLNFVLTGFNGLDVGGFTANESYSIYAIADATGNNPPGVIASLTTNPFPRVPSGYGLVRRIGYVITEVGPSVKEFSQTGTAEARTTQYFSSIPALTNGTSVGNFVSLNLISPTVTMPKEAGITFLAILQMSANFTAGIRPTGNLTANLARCPVSIRGSAGCGPIQVISGQLFQFTTPSIDYTNDGGTLSIIVTGFVDYL